MTNMQTEHAKRLRKLRTMASRHGYMISQSCRGVNLYKITWGARTVFDGGIGAELDAIEEYLADLTLRQEWLDWEQHHTP